MTKPSRWFVIFCLAVVGGFSQTPSVDRVPVVEGEGYFPVAIRLAGGEILAVVRGGAGHMGRAGRLDLVISRDQGRTWSPSWTVVDGPDDDRNPALGQLADGTILLAYAVLTGYDAEPQLSDLPDQVTFIYDTAAGKVIPASIRITPENIGSTDALLWAVSYQSGWFSVSPDSGVSPESFTLSPNLPVSMIESPMTGVVTLVVTSPADTAGSPHQIDVSMDVVNGILRSVYIPLVINPLY